MAKFLIFLSAEEPYSVQNIKTEDILVLSRRLVQIGFRHRLGILLGGHIGCRESLPGLRKEKRYNPTIREPNVCKKYIGL